MQKYVASVTDIDTFFIFFLVFFFNMALNGHYGRRRPFWDEMRPVARLCLMLWAVDCAVLLAFRVPEALIGSILCWGGFATLVGALRSLTRVALDHLGLWRIETIIVGSGENARQAAEALNAERGMGSEVTGFMSLSAGGPTTLRVAGVDFPVSPWEIEQANAVTSGKHIVVALEEAELPLARELFIEVSKRALILDVVPPVRGIPLYGLEVNHLLARELLVLSVRNNLRRAVSRVTKRTSDLLLGLALLVVLSPLLILLAILVRRTPGPVFFGHKRVGQGGREFSCYKFRSMRADAQEVLKKLLAEDANARAEWERDFKLKNDPRITSVGDFLRRTSLDELPQLFNVIKGDMSLVGPRPVVAEELERYGAEQHFYLQVKPGITGLWQVSGRNDVDYSHRVFLDTWYVRNWSLWYDFSILVRTAIVVLKRKGAY